MIMSTWLRFAKVVVAFALFLGSASAAPARKERAKPPAAATVEELAPRIRPSVVVVSHFGRDGKEAGVGAGFIISSNGLIATSLHVIGEARPVIVKLASGREHEATEIHAWDRNLDLAIVRIDARNLPALALGDSDQLAQGSAVVAMGNPLGMQHSIVQGVVSARRDFEGVAMIQLAIPIEPGNSGGPLVDMHGRVHGLLSLKSALTANLGFAMPVNELKKLIAKPNPVPMTRWLTIAALNAKEWEPLMGARWRQRGGRMQVEGAGKGFGGRSLCLSHKTVPERPYEVAVSVRLGDEAGAAGLVFAADGKDTHYGFYPTAGQLRLTRFEGPAVFSWTILSTTNSGHYRAGHWNDLRVRVETNKLFCYVNDQLVIESGDAALTGGRVGLAKFRQTKAEFREFRIGTRLDPRPATAPQLARLLSAAGDLQEDALRPLLKTNAANISRALTEEASRLEQRATRMREMAKNAQYEATQHELVRVMTAPDPEIDLFHAALLISKLDNPELDVQIGRAHV